MKYFEIKFEAFLTLSEALENQRVYIYTHSAAAEQVCFRISTRCVFIHIFYELIIHI